MPDQSHQGTGIKDQLYSYIRTPYMHFWDGIPLIIAAFKIIFDNYLNLLPMTWSLTIKPAYQLRYGLG
jgi:hypothetical protein